jgi:hypothetical protein
VQCDPELAAAAGVEVDVLDELAHHQPDRGVGVVNVPGVQRTGDEAGGGPGAIARG